MSVDQQLVARDRRIVALWNDGLTASALSTRFTLTVDGVFAVLRRAKADGAVVREGRRAWA